MTDYGGFTKAELTARLDALEAKITEDNLLQVTAIAERKRDQSALRDSEVRLRAILDTAVEGIITIDERGLMESFNAAAEKIFGYSADEVIGRNVSILMPMPYRHEHDGYLANYAQTGSARIIGIGREVMGQRKDRTLFPMDLSISEVRLEGRRIFTGFVRDISQRKQAEQATRHLAAIVEDSGDAIISKNLEGVIATWNKGAEKLFGYQAGEIVGKPILTLIPPQWHAEEQNILERIRNDERINHYETVRRRKNGSLIEVSLTVSAIKDTYGKIVGVSKIARDITERKRLEKEILEIRDSEQRRIGQDLHDGLSQHLAGIEMMLQVLKQNLGGTSKSASVQADKIAKHMREAISQTRMLARGLSPVSVESNGLMSALQELAASASELFDIRCFFKCAEPILINENAMATQLFRIAQEALNNAVKHGKAEAVEIRLQKSASGAQLIITDNGRGFPKRLVRNKGMGLRIMKYRADMIGAALEIGPANRKGTVVTCAFKL